MTKSWYRSNWTFSSRGSEIWQRCKTIVWDEKESYVDVFSFHIMQNKNECCFTSLTQHFYLPVLLNNRCRNHDPWVMLQEPFQILNYLTTSFCSKTKYTQAINLLCYLFLYHFLSYVRNIALIVYHILKNLLFN